MANNPLSNPPHPTLLSSTFFYCSLFAPRSASPGHLSCSPLDPLPPLARSFSSSSLVSRRHHLFLLPNILPRNPPSPPTPVFSSDSTPHPPTPTSLFLSLSRATTHILDSQPAVPAAAGAAAGTRCCVVCGRKERKGTEGTEKGSKGRDAGAAERENWVWWRSIIQQVYICVPIEIIERAKGGGGRIGERAGSPVRIG